MKNIKNTFVLHLALWLPLIISTPFIIMVQNPDDFQQNIITQLALLMLIMLFLTLLTFLISKILPKSIQLFFIGFILALATAIIIQGYFIHGLFDYGTLNGHIVHWDTLGLMYWLEIGLFCLLVILLTFIYIKTKIKLKNVALVLIIFSIIQALLLVPSLLASEAKSLPPKKYDDSVFQFSSSNNIIHLLADGFQADIAKQVLEENPELAKQFSGFDFFQNHLGHYQATAPTIPSILTGKFFDLDKGYNVQSFQKNIQDNSYANVLHENGYAVDITGISTLYCIKQARNCIGLSINDLKPKGYLHNKSVLTDLALVLDVSFFRHLPMFLKENIYNNGSWLFSSKFGELGSSHPGPVIREWIENMEVSTTQPIYKWYHFIGTHIPAQWDENCTFVGRQPQTRSAYKAQTHCVLKEIASLIEKLKQMNIYDKTMIVINGDHGCNIPANDLYGKASNVSIFTDRLLGVVRPLFMLKKPAVNHPLNFDDAPTTMEDIVPTILDAAGFNSAQYNGVSAFQKNNDGINSRGFNWFDSKTFWAGGPVKYDEYSVSGDIKNRSSWHFVDIHNTQKAPSSYQKISYDSAYPFSKGFSLSIKNRKTQKSSYVYGKELFILLSNNNASTQNKKLIITLKIPKQLKKQSIIITINHAKTLNEINIETSENKWVTTEVAIPDNLLKEENNFFHIVFSHVEDYKPNVPITAKVRSIEIR